MSTIYTKTDTFTPVEQFDCTNCGSALSVMNPRAKYFACQYCGSVLDSKTPEHEVLSSIANPTSYQPFSFVKIGQVANFFDKKYQVIARTRWQQNYREYWSEDGDTGYSTEIWQYDEWLMISELRTYFYLIEDKNGFYISEEIIPDKPIMPDTYDLDFEKISLFEEHRPQIIQEYGKANVLYFEGESNYTIKIADTVGFAMYRNRREEFYVEWREDEEGVVKEIEFFKETPIRTLDVLKAFEQNEAVQKLLARKKIWRDWYRAAVFSSILFFCLSVFSCTKSESVIFEQTFTLGDTNGDQFVTSKSIQIQTTGVHRLSLEAEFSQPNTEAFVVAFFTDEEGQVINRLDGDFYTWAGVEDGEYSSEDVVENSKVVNIETAGTYFARFLTQKTIENPGTVTLTISRGILMTRWFIIAMILALILALISWIQKQKI